MYQSPSRSSTAVNSLCIAVSIPSSAQPANRRLTAPLGAQPTLQESAPFYGADSYRGRCSLSYGAPVPDEPMKNLRPSSNVRSRALARAVRSLLW